MLCIFPFPKDRKKIEGRNQLKCSGAGVSRPSFFSISEVNTFPSKKKKYSLKQHQGFLNGYEPRNTILKTTADLQLVMKTAIE